MTKQTGSGSTILIILLAVLALGALGWAVVNQSMVDKLKRELTQTQDQLEQVVAESEAAKQEVAQAALEGAQGIGQTIQGVENPQLRLSLFQAYASKLRTLLTPESQAELDKVVVYVEKQPVVLVQQLEQMPAEIQTAIQTIKTEMGQAKVKPVASTQITDAAIPTPAEGKTVTLTGTLEFVQVDPVTGAGIFKLVDPATEQEYYFQFNAANTQQYQASLVDQNVTVTVKTTGTENGYVTYDVVSGPTKVSASPTSAAVPTE